MGNFMKFRRKITAFMAEHGSQAKDIFDGKLNAMDLCLLKRELLNPA